MSKEFALLKASGQLESYLSRERYNLDKMRDNPRVSQSLFETKAGHLNELVDILNRLFGTMVGVSNTEDPLFARYRIADDTEEFDTGLDYVIPDEISDTDKESIQREPVEPIEPVEPVEPVSEEPPEQWELDGYASYEDWLKDKELETLNQRDDLDITDLPALSERRMTTALEEYERFAKEDISEYDPEADEPVSVIGRDVEDDEGDAPSEPDEVEAVERPTQNVDYMTRTLDNLPIDKDPTQIADVQTAVERDDGKAHTGVNIDVRSQMSGRSRTVVDDVIDAELNKLLGRSIGETVESTNDEEDGADEPADDE